ncbi:hypothetical protein [Aquimarina sp. MAR_2010_214]|uniref:hypothetical protein n=1 Tax=Aquimarina sp. MAR_2010_214 TaxID=1250026 RepID=UPI001E551278|nr:hypothetical protein [Aquimarina sp. MAR_2010_214]
MITDVTPKDGDDDIDVFAAPQATFAMKVNQPIVIPEDDGDKTYKVILEKFTVVDETEKEIKGVLEWGYLNDRVTFVSDDILPPTTKLKATVEVSFQEKVDGVFKTILDEGQKAIEIEERNFTTGTAPDHIPLHNIQYSYPVVDQQLFYAGEHGTGYIQLKRGQDYLFDNTQWKSTVKYSDENGKINESVFRYNTSDNKVKYTLPKVSKDTKYLMAIVSTTKASEKSSTETTTETKDYGQDNTVEIRKNNAQNIIKEGEIERLTYEFKSSQYKTFAAKVKNISVENNEWGKITSDVIFLTSKIKNHEGFDIAELVGSKYTENKPLVAIESTMKDKYLNKDITPVIYQSYGIHKKYTISRDPSILGFIPKKALPVNSRYLTSLEREVNLDWRAVNFPYRYNLPEAYKIDYIDIRNKVSNDYVNGAIPANDPVLQILSNEYLFIRHGNYNVKLTYMLPGGITGSNTIYKYKNPIKIR